MDGGGWNRMELALTVEHADACDRGCGRVDGEQVVDGRMGGVTGGEGCTAYAGWNG